MNKGITLEQSQMIELRLQGRNITDISGIIHKSRQTIYAWLDLPAIKEEIEFRKTEMKKTIKDKIAAEANQCIVNLLDMAHNSKDQRIKFQANKYLVDQYLGVPGTITENEETSDDKNYTISIEDMLAEIEKDNN